MWNTWSFQGNTRLIHNTAYFEFIIGILNQRKRKIWIKFIHGTGVPDEFRADSENFGVLNVDPANTNPKNLGAIEKYGPHETHMRYMNLIIKGEYNKYLIEASAFEENLFIKISALEETDVNEKIICIGKGIWGRQFNFQSVSTNFFSGNYKKNKIQGVFSKQPMKFFTFNTQKGYLKGLKDKNPRGNYGKTHIFVEFDNELPLYVAINVVESTKTPLITQISEIPEEIQKQKEIYDKQCFKLKFKDQEIGNAIIRAILWNLIWNDDKKIPSTPVTKSWVEMTYNLISKLLKNNIFFIKLLSLLIPSIRHQTGSIIFTWDTSFNALIMSLEDINFAKEILLNLFKVNFDEATGRMNQVSFTGQNLDCTNPPVTPFCAWKIYLKCKDKDFLGKIYEPLKKWFYWLVRERDRNKDGLFEWGCYDPIQIGPLKLKLGFISTLDRAAYESGWDNGVQWFHDITFSSKYHCMAMNCVDLCSFCANFAWILSLMAHEMGKEEEAQYFSRSYKTIKQLIDTKLYDTEENIYKNCHWNGNLQSILTGINFYPLIANIPTQERAQQIITRHLYNEKEFWGPYLIPTIAKNSPYYEEHGDYWKGNIWPPVNYIIHLGLTNYDNEASYKVAENSMNIFLNEWIKEGHIHELLNSSTGLGTSDKNKAFRSCPFYTWGALMGLMFVEEFFDVELDGRGIRFGNFYNDKEVLVENMYYLGAKYNIKSGAHQTAIWRNNELIFEAHPGVIIRHFHKTENYLTFECYSRKGSTINLKIIDFDTIIKIEIDGEEKFVHEKAEKGIIISLDKKICEVKILFN